MLEQKVCGARDRWGAALSTLCAYVALTHVTDLSGVELARPPCAISRAVSRMVRTRDLFGKMGTVVVHLECGVGPVKRFASPGLQSSKRARHRRTRKRFVGGRLTLHTFLHPQQSRICLRRLLL